MTVYFGKTRVEDSRFGDIKMDLRRFQNFNDPQRNKKE
jgi:hypothetical protein